jgi:hypothetical protein
MDVLTNEVKEFQMKLEAILKEFLDQGSILNSSRGRPMR